MNWLVSLIKNGLGYASDMGAKFAASVIKGAGLDYAVGMKSKWEFEAFDKDGNPLWDESIFNTVVNVGLDDLLDKYFKGSTYTAAFYVGLTDGATVTVAAGDTMSSHAGWTEVVAYSEATRETLTLGTVSGQSVDNSASKASFSINSDSTTIGGGFLTTNSTKSGTTGILYGAAAFTAGDKALDNGDTLNVTVTLTAASA